MGSNHSIPYKSCWATCPDCGNIQPEQIKNFQRTSRPRCVNCGGFVQASVAAQEVMQAGVSHRSSMRWMKRKDWEDAVSKVDNGE